jgi:hypothetical protein
VTETISPMPEQIDAQQLAQQLVEQARADGVELVDPGGALRGLTRTVLEPHWTPNCLSIWVTTSTTQPAATARTRAMTPDQDGAHRSRSKARSNRKDDGMPRMIVLIDPALGFTASDMASRWNQSGAATTLEEAKTESPAEGTVFPQQKHVMVLPQNAYPDMTSASAGILEIARELWNRDSSLPEPEVVAYERSTDEIVIQVRQRRSR